MTAKRPRKKTATVKGNEAPAAVAIATAEVPAKIPVELPPVTKELAGPWHFTVKGEGMEDMASRNDESWVDIAHRAAHIVGELGWFVDGNPNDAFRILKFNQAAREVVVEVAVAALKENPSARRSPHLTGGSPLSWDQRKHPETAALIAKYGGKPLNFTPLA